MQYRAWTSTTRAYMIDCQLDEFVPLPSKSDSAPNAFSYSEIRTRAKAACAAAALLSSEGYADPLKDVAGLQSAAHGILKQTAEGKNVKSSEVGDAISTPEGAVFVDRLLSAFDMEVVRDAKRLRNYVTNRLVVESDSVDPRIRMRALELLGKISDVGLFTERTEITINNRSTVELENSLRDKLRKLMNVDSAEDAVEIDRPRLAAHEIKPSEILSGL